MSMSRIESRRVARSDTRNEARGQRALRELPFLLRNLVPERSEGARISRGLGAFLALALAATPTLAFCGFYVAQADGTLSNRTSRAVLARDGNTTTITMANDYAGDLDEFALVVPVPEVIEQHQVRVVERSLIDHLDAFTGPRLVEYHDPSPCAVPRPTSLELRRELSSMGYIAQNERADGVTIAAAYSVGEYDIRVLSAEQSGGLLRWLQREGYRLPPGAERILDSYLRQGLFFFVAKVSLEAAQSGDFEELRPLQVRFTSRRFGLPIRLGTLNADGPQDLVLWTLTRNGRVEPTNYRTVRARSDEELPVFVRDDFGSVYGAIFDEQTRRDGRRTVVLEHAWDAGWCDPCVTAPLREEQLIELGADWIRQEAPRRRGVPRATFVTRLHVRYTADTFPDDLRLQETGDQTPFQTRFILHNAYPGPLDCRAGRDYLRRLERQRQERLENLLRLTGWSQRQVIRRWPGHFDDRSKEELPADDRAWWQRLWPGGK